MYSVRMCRRLYARPMFCGKGLIGYTRSYQQLLFESYYEWRKNNVVLY
jgi:hypothetical protein